MDSASSVASEVSIAEVEEATAEVEAVEEATAPAVATTLPTPEETANELVEIEREATPPPVAEEVIADNTPAIAPDPLPSVPTDRETAAPLTNHAPWWQRWWRWFRR